ncbi:hypothetical protein V6N11_001129 [Hibiscus sabdariffa]|uniref:Uncharacterized protein n=1 Tax=Hibiscus sabdariffa TaxID=183260 RepID=A0ABR2RYU5_9ROSI
MREVTGESDVMKNMIVRNWLETRCVANASTTKTFAFSTLVAFRLADILTISATEPHPPELKACSFAMFILLCLYFTPKSCKNGLHQIPSINIPPGPNNSKSK